MSGETSNKFPRRRRRSLFLYAFGPTHLKDVFVSMATAYESESSSRARHFFIADFCSLAPKIVTITSYPIALTCRFIQVLILIYACAYIMWYKRGYQDRDPSIISSVTLDVKGIGFYGDNQSKTIDSADFIVPPQENNAVFIMTNFLRTDQQRTRCADGIDVKDAFCSNQSQCTATRKYPYKINGRWTGDCRFPEGRCEIEGWCPVEYDLDIPEPVFGVSDYTIIVHNFIEFTRFGISRKNVLDDSEYFRTCHYHPVTDRLCPAIRLGDLLDLVESDDDERKKMLIYGAVVRIKIDWMCNLDLGEDECRPDYSFGRLDSRSRDEQFSFGFNFRYASHWKVDNASHRTLTKAYGLRLIVTVNGDAGRFDLFVLTLNIGSMIGVLGLATVICDILALHFSKKSYYYRTQKFQSMHSERSADVI